MTKNLALKTLVKICIPDVKSLQSPPDESHTPRWKITALAADDTISIVWVAKEGDPTNDALPERKKPAIEAHFAGTKKEFLKFRQKIHSFQREAVVSIDISRVLLNMK